METTTQLEAIRVEYECSILSILKKIYIVQVWSQRNVTNIGIWIVYFRPLSGSSLMVILFDRASILLGLSGTQLGDPVLDNVQMA
jgi:hypothetical protein